MSKGLFDYVFCCLSEDQQKTLEAASDSIDIEFVRHAQKNLTREKHGYRCSKCGAFYPDVQLLYCDRSEDARKYTRLPGKGYRCKKAADVFCGQHYYAKNGNTLLRFDTDTAYNAHQTDSIPIRRDVCHITLSPDEKYIATETFSGTLNVIDTQTKLLAAHRQRTPINGAFRFTHDHRLLYFFNDSIRCWDFIGDQDTILFQIPELWKRGDKPRETFTFVCSDIIYHPRADTYQFVCTTRKKTYIVSIRDGRFSQVVQLPRTPAFGHLVLAEEADQYTFSDGKDVIIYDSQFRVIERFAPPQIIELRGGKTLPVSHHTSFPYPHRTLISPNGKWLLLNYFSALVLMKREGLEVRYCLSSHNGGHLGHVRFLDSDHFWYTKGDTTYIQPIGT